jgi:hypothetical protein
VNANGQVELADIKEAIEAGRVRITDNAYEEANADGLKFDEIYFSATHGVVIQSHRIRLSLQKSFFPQLMKMER